MHTAHLSLSSVSITLGIGATIMHREPEGPESCGLIASYVLAQSISGSVTEGLWPKFKSSFVISFPGCPVKHS